MGKSTLHTHEAFTLSIISAQLLSILILQNLSLLLRVAGVLIRLVRWRIHETDRAHWTLSNWTHQRIGRDRGVHNDVPSMVDNVGESTIRTREATVQVEVSTNWSSRETVVVVLRIVRETTFRSGLFRRERWKSVERIRFVFRRGWENWSLVRVGLDRHVFLGGFIL